MIRTTAAAMTALVAAAMTIAQGVGAAGDTDAEQRPPLRTLTVDDLALGMTQADAQARHVGFFWQARPYRDPKIGLRYEATYGRTVIEEIVGETDHRQDDATVFLRAALTGPDAAEGARLYAITQRAIGPEASCARTIARYEQSLGAPDIDNRPARLEWRDWTLAEKTTLTIVCPEEHEVETRLVNDKRRTDFLDALRDTLRPFIKQFLEFEGLSR